jgi:hypothetical protein
VSRPDQLPNTPRTAHQYLHDEGVWPDEDEAWHERVCENLRYVEAEAAAPGAQEARPRMAGELPGE